MNNPPERFWCPICGEELRASEHVDERRWPAGAPKRSPYLVRREYTVRRCRNGHVLYQHGGVLASRLADIWT